MNYRTLKDTELLLSNLCLGTAPFGEKITQEDAFELLDLFVRHGGNFLDTANIYCRWVPGLENCSEQVLGAWIKARGAYKDVVIATKGAHYQFEGREHISRVNEKEIRRDLEESLRTLGLDTIDFYWLHRDDMSKTMEEILDILEKLKAEGKIRYYGLSNYQTSRLEEARKCAERKGFHGPYAISNQWSMATINPGKNTNPDPTLVELHEDEYEWHKKYKVPVIPFSATGQGWFEKMRRAGVHSEHGKCQGIDHPEMLKEEMKNAYWNEENLRRYETLLQAQKETGYSLQALSLAWLLKQPFQVFPVCGARTTMQLEGILEAAEEEILQWITL